MNPFIMDRDLLDLETLMMLRGIKGKAVDAQETGNPLTFVTDLARPLKSLLIPFSPRQEGSGDPSPQNIRPILPWNGLTVFGGGKNLLNFSVPEADPDNTGAGNSNKRIFTPFTFCKGITANNYFNKEYVETYSIQGNTLTMENNRAGYGIGFALPLKAGKTYAIQCEGENYRVNIGFYAKDGSFISATNTVLYYDEGSSYSTFGIPSGAEMAVFVFVCKTVGSPAIYRNVQIEAGGAVTTFENPVTPSVCPVSFPSTVYGGTLDVVSGVLSVEWIALITKWKNGEQSAQIGDFVRRTFQMPSTVVDASGTATAYCNVAKWLWDYDRQVTHFYAHRNNAYIILPADTDGETDIVVVGQLATPQEITLTQEQITALVGDNTIWSDADGSMTAVYLKKG